VDKIVKQHLQLAREHQRLKAEKAKQDRAKADRYPLSSAVLWRPHCEQWLGLPEGTDPRSEGCGQEMTPCEPGVFVCRTPDCPMEGVPETRSSQRDALAGLLSGNFIAGLIGGANRAGKTESMAQLLVAVAAGRGEPWVQRWMAANDIPEHAIQEAPTTVWFSALTFSDSKKYHRPKLDEYLPKGTRRRNWAAENEAEATLPNGGKIICKAEAQGRKSYQGAAVPLVVLDEEHKEEVYVECLRATAEDDGLVVLSMTPLMGVTWPHKVFIREPSPDHYSRTILGLDNPHVPSHALRRRWKALSPEKRDARLLGRWATAKGIVFPQFSRVVHVIDDVPVPTEWSSYRALDFGIWFGCVWAALDPQTDTLHLYRARKTYDVPLSENARVVRGLSARLFSWTVADPAGKDERDELEAHHHITTLPAKKSVELGLDAVHERLAVGNQGHPGLVIHRTAAAQLIDELTTYKRNERGDIVKANDHLVDCLRYLIYYLKLDIPVDHNAAADAMADVCADLADFDDDDFDTWS